ncbi:hypothetical protein SAMN05444397_101722 [Flavobacterium aquidurense]|uniref:Helix-turn-helix domain-containing protein n=1 Tax=Flavobacterium frigidimaris TaxID=262320 RepID=A0ABX4BUL1_FLAFR|nr:hypothetical protein [Flavobacterium frigidimaris]OXA80980.1 hypothetical protein B0A65_05265 [Flavobacterium frigidimaris]SDY47031.1 hypothetical protein SAMN05444397_101722 [Flavobacterium aquidurense]
MKKLYLNTGGFETIFNDLKDSFDGELVVNNNEYTLNIKSKWARGTVKAVRFEKEMSYVNFDLVFNHDVTLSIESLPTAPVFFAYCEKGTIAHSFGANGAQRKIKSNQSAILNNTSVINSVLFFESHKPIQFSLVGMPTTFSAKEENVQMVSQLKKRFTTDSGQYLYIGSKNHKIIEKLQELSKIPQKGIVRSLLQKSILDSILEIEIAQHSYNYIKTIEPIVDLATRQINEIKRISNINIIEVLHAAASRNYLPRIFKEKYHLSFKPYNQKLAS